MKWGNKTVAFVASTSGTGKTSLMEAVIALLKQKGFRVGAVKHTIHDAAIDREGSDSRRFSEAGSDVTILASREQMAVVKKMEGPVLDEVFEEASRDTDIILVEGFKELDLPKIELYRSGHTKGLFSRSETRSDKDLIAVASDVSLKVDVPVLDINDPEEICEFIIERFLKGGD